MMEYATKPRRDGWVRDSDIRRARRSERRSYPHPEFCVVVQWHYGFKKVEFCLKDMKHIIKNSKGFTLIELLVVIAIIAVLAVAVILTLNPAELLKQARDSTRVSDMSTLK